MRQKHTFMAACPVPMTSPPSPAAVVSLHVRTGADMERSLPETCCTQPDTQRVTWFEMGQRDLL